MNEISAEPVENKPTTIDHHQNKKLGLQINTNSVLTKKLYDLAETSTSHGLPNIVRTNRISLKIIWLICFLAALGACIYMVYKTLNEYYGYEVVTNIQVVNENSPTFPTVTICNVNPLTSKQAEQLIEKISYVNTEMNVSIFASTFDIFSSFIGYLNDFIYLAQSNAFAHDISNDERKTLGNLPIILKCTFNEQSCGSDQLKWHYDASMGNCLRFNSGFELDLMRSLNSGRAGGLHLELIILEAENKYVSLFSYSEGLRVFIHNSSFDIRESEGVDVPLSKATNIAIKRTFVSKQASPYSDCVDIDSYNSEFVKFIKDSARTYRQIDCFDLCLQKKIIQSCGCYEVRYPRLYNHSTGCNIKDLYWCSRNVSQTFRTNQIDPECVAKCPLECDSVKYGLSLSSSTYPSKQNAEFYAIKYPSYSYGLLKNRSVEMNIYYSDLSYTLISESPKTSVIDLFSNIGGTMGLYIGVSFLSFVEIVEALLEIIFISFNINV